MSEAEQIDAWYREGVVMAQMGEPIPAQENAAGRGHWQARGYQWFFSRLDAEQQRQRAVQLRSALAALVGVDGREELEAMEVSMRTIPAPAEDKAAAIGAIQALLATLPAVPHV